MTQPNPAYQPGHYGTPTAQPTTYQPTPPPRRRRRWPWVVGGIILISLLACGIGGIALLGTAAQEVDQQIQHGLVEKKKDIKITSCKKGALGVDIAYTVTNSSDRTESYTISFEARDKAGVRIGEAIGVINSLSAGATAKDTTVAVTDGAVATCVVTRVD